ncbi:response regulator transcription factor [Exiguobacterium sp. SH1S21]|uniref:response regulator transcription factor n=1 Tax=Exiguobacterium sp. SH1S21 TaxID=2510953 RepID=UPI00103C0CC7|nr:response regulator transcription factor [Exiguobacterium sp. SH1S21]TCI51477.1 response regulator transcription factor [Exiguobacterium sp. SH1S21]
MERKICIMICDDNIAVHESIRAYLEAERMESISVYNGEDALKMIGSKTVDLIVLDIMLPGLFGTEVCKKIRESSSLPILMLSARGEENDRILGLEIGADDYLTKPFSPREVVTRIKTILRRVHGPKEHEPKHRAGNFTISLETYEARIQGETVDLTPKEIKLMANLMTNVGKVMSREELLDRVFGYDYPGDIRAVDTLIKRIRQKIGDLDTGFIIRSVYGVGYKIEIMG